MNKITKQEVEDFVSDLGEITTEHRRGSTFYASCSYTFKQNDIDELKSEDIDASDFLNVNVTLNGIYDDYHGCEWNSMDFHKIEEYEEFIPEQVIPAHTVVKQRAEKFDYKWE